MANPLQRPNGEGTSRSYLVALAVMVVPVVQRYLQAHGYQVDDGMLRDGIVVLLGLAVLFLRRGMKQAGLSGEELQRVMDRFQELVAENRGLMHQVEAYRSGQFGLGLVGRAPTGQVNPTPDEGAITASEAIEMAVKADHPED